MPVHEIKNPFPRSEPAPQRSEAPEPVHRLAPVIRIKHQQGRRDNAELDKENKQAANLPPASGEKTLLRLLRRFNEALERQRIPLHLMLITEGEGYLLEIYDCTPEQVCMAIRDLEILPADLPAFLGKLQREVGLLVDTFS